MADNRSGKPGIDLDAMSVADLTALRDAAEAKRLEKLEDAKAAVIERARAEIEQLGLQFEAVFPKVANASADSPRRTRKDAGEPVPVKFRGPNGETWTGRGRMPKWLQAMEAEGRNRKDFAV
jgi:DNA-binding protein H-NS